MEWNQIEGQWDIIKGKAKEKWGKFTDDDLMQIKGKKDELVGRVKHVYGVAKEEAEKQIEEFRIALKKTEAPTEDLGARATQVEPPVVKATHLN